MFSSFSPPNITSKAILLLFSVKKNEEFNVPTQKLHIFNGDEWSYATSGGQSTRLWAQVNNPLLFFMHHGKLVFPWRYQPIIELTLLRETHQAVSLSLSISWSMVLASRSIIFYECNGGLTNMPFGVHIIVLKIANCNIRAPRAS